MSWITHILPKIKREDDNERKPSPIPEGVWTKCPGCEQPLYTEELRASLQVCPKCGYHRQTPQVAVTKVLATGADSSDIILDIFGHEHEVHVNLPGGYNIYNACASMTRTFSLPLNSPINT